MNDERTAFIESPFMLEEYNKRRGKSGKEEIKKKQINIKVDRRKVD